MNDATIPNFKGFIVGNGVDDMLLPGALGERVKTLWGKGFISYDGLQLLTSAKCLNATVAPADCERESEKLEENMQLSDIYNLYAKCYATERPRPMHPLQGIASKPHLGETPPCVECKSLTDWLNRKDVQRAIHINASITWSICSAIDYHVTDRDMTPIYKAAAAAGIRILLYSGDIDN
eukprot:323531_1